jgi:hypothetical protein
MLGQTLLAATGEHSAERDWPPARLKKLTSRPELEEAVF